MPVESLIEHLVALKNCGIERIPLPRSHAEKLRALLNVPSKVSTKNQSVSQSANIGSVTVDNVKVVQKSAFERNSERVTERVSEPLKSFNTPEIKNETHPVAKKSSIDITAIAPVKLPAGDKKTQWEWLRNHVLTHPEVLRHIRKDSGVQPVFGVGNIDSPIFFCGEAPGAEEEQQGEPFVGRAGQLLTKIINAMGFQRSDVYIANILNWRPEKEDMSVGNRPPTVEEMAQCLPFLKAQVEVVKPKVIVALGATAVTGLLGVDPDRRMGDVRGKFFDFAHNGGKTPVMVTYHPSYLLRNNTNAAKRVVWEDILCVMKRVGMKITPAQEKYFT